MIPFILSITLSILLFPAFGGDIPDETLHEPPPFQLASDRLFQPEFYSLVQGKTIGFFGNQTSLKTLDRLIDDPEVEVRRIFVPEHGLMGVVEAGEDVSNGTYRNVPVISAYGYGARKIDPARLEDLDLFVFEIQDIGNRHYTYISSLYLQMDSCADAGIPMLLLDRPNAAGDKVEGPIIEPDRQSYIGLFGPVAHGMTIGELANFFHKESFWMNGDRYPRMGEDAPFANLSDLDLTVLPMESYDRRKGFYQTEELTASWVSTSPNIPSPESAICYKGNGLLDGHELKEIVSGYKDNQVQQFSAIQLPGMETLDEMMTFIQSCYNQYDFPGVKLTAKKNLINDQWDILQFTVTDLEEYHSTLSILAILYTWESGHHPGEDHGFKNREQFNKSMGNGWISEILVSTENYRFEDIIQLLKIDETLFQEARKPYLLY